jgi:hypothetical protein
VVIESADLGNHFGKGLCYTLNQRVVMLRKLVSSGKFAHHIYDYETPSQFRWLFAFILAHTFASIFSLFI